MFTMSNKNFAFGKTPLIPYTGSLISSQIISDLHIDKSNPTEITEYLVPSANTLLIAGDVGRISDDKRWSDYVRFMASAANVFHSVYFVVGNHEYYIGKGSSWDMETVNRKLQSIPVMYPNVRWLNNFTINIHEHNLDIFGGTYWSQLPYGKFLQLAPQYPIKSGDHFLTSTDYNFLHESSRKSLEEAIRYKNKYCPETRFVALTHHAPTFTNTLKPEYDSSENPKTNLYCSASDEILCSGQISTWVCGHTHYNFDFVVPATDGGTSCRVVSNQFTAKGYDPKKVIEI